MTIFIVAFRVRTQKFQKQHEFGTSLPHYLQVINIDIRFS